MPTPRRRSTTAQPTSPSTPLATTSTRPLRSTPTPLRHRTTTPTPTPSHHHKSADELAVLEAEKILHTTPLSSHHRHDLRNGGSERDRRHWKLEEAREALERDERSRKGDSESVASVVREVEDAGEGEGKAEVERKGRKISLGSEEDGSLIQENNGGLNKGLAEPATQGSEVVLDLSEDIGRSEAEGSEEKFGMDDLELPMEMMDERTASTGTMDILHEAVSDNEQVTGDPSVEESVESDDVQNDLAQMNGIREQDDNMESESSSGSDTSDSSSTSETSEDDDEGEEEEDEDEDEDEAMERLLEAAKRAAIAKSRGKGKDKASLDTQDDDEVVLQFDESEGKRTKQA